MPTYVNDPVNLKDNSISFKFEKYIIGNIESNSFLSEEEINIRIEKYKEKIIDFIESVLELEVI